MPTIVSLTLNGIGGADHVFAPYGVNSNVVTWYKPGAAPVADEKLTHSLTRLPGGRVKLMMKMVLPKSEDVDGVIKVVRTAYMAVELSCDGSHTSAERGEMLDLLRSLVSSSDAPSISTSWVDAQPYY